MTMTMTNFFSITYHLLLPVTSVWLPVCGPVAKEHWWSPVFYYKITNASYRLLSCTLSTSTYYHVLLPTTTYECLVSPTILYIVYFCILSCSITYYHLLMLGITYLVHYLLLHTIMSYYLLEVMLWQVMLWHAFQILVL